jgi:hypothetical protein
MSYSKSYRGLAKGECKDYRYDYFVAFDGALMIKKDDYIVFYNGRRWFKGYFKGYMLRICRRMSGRLERRHFISLLTYDGFRWVEELFTFGKVYGIKNVFRVVGGRWVSVFPRE